MTRHAVLPALFTSLALLAGCDCAGPTRTCTGNDDCPSGSACVDEMCRPIEDIDGSIPGSDVPMCATDDVCGRDCCGDGEECVEGFACAPVCENTRCGDNLLTCCAAGQACLDGVVCAADCDDGRALCGAALDVCCDAGDVCVEDACVTPGETCGDDFDCLTEGTYCEPTIGRCLTNPAPPLCEVRPDFDEVALEVEWHWPGETVGGTLYANVVGAPSAGDVSGDGVPDVVIAPYAGNSLGTTLLVAIDGRMGTTLWSRSGSNGGGSQATAALANLDPSDDGLEVAYVTNGRALVILDGNGTTELARVASATSADYGSPSIHDIDRDGDIEVVVGGRAWAFEGSAGAFTLRSLFDNGSCNVNSVDISTVANLDADPELEITCGGVAWDTDGTRLWPTSGPLIGQSAVADFDGDGLPEVVMVRAGAMTMRDGATGALRMGAGGTWFDGALDIPGGGDGGPPTIADFDGDGLPEISAAGRGAYAVYDLDCVEPRVAGREAGTCDRMTGTTGATRWSAEVQDFSSSRTGSSVFDFQGDGIAEVVYADECFLHVFDGRAGAEILMEPWANSSRTGCEYPIVVDVDRDGNSEIVLVANNDEIVRDDCTDTWHEAFGIPAGDPLPERFRSGTQGVWALGDPGDRWVRTRPIWNQFSYAVTHVDDRGAIPATPEDNWDVEGLNNFRQNVQGAGVFNAPNLTVELEVVAACGRGEMRLSALVRNAGSRGVAAGVPVTFVRTDPAPEVVIETVMTMRPLLPGATERVTVVAEDQPTDVDLRFEVRVDGEAASTVIECDEDDNTANGMEMCPGLE